MAHIRQRNTETFFEGLTESKQSKWDVWLLCSSMLILVWASVTFRGFQQTARSDATSFSGRRHHTAIAGCDILPASSWWQRQLFWPKLSVPGCARRTFELRKGGSNMLLETRLTLFLVWLYSRRLWHATTLRQILLDGVCFWPKIINANV